jgi:hypothetical protein
MACLRMTGPKGNRATARPVPTSYIVKKIPVLDDVGEGVVSLPGGIARIKDAQQQERAVLHVA